MSLNIIKKYSTSLVSLVSLKIPVFFHYSHPLLLKWFLINPPKKWVSAWHHRKLIFPFLPIFASFNRNSAFNPQIRVKKCKVDRCRRSFALNTFLFFNFYKLISMISNKTSILSVLILITLFLSGTLFLYPKSTPLLTIKTPLSSRFPPL